MSDQQQPYRSVDKFDRMMGALTSLPEVASTKASTVVATTPLLGCTQTFIIQTFRQIDRDGEESKSRDTLFLQYVDDEGRIRLVVPHEAIMTIIRQHDALSTKTRKRIAKEQAQMRKARGELPGFMKGKKPKKQASE